MKGLLFKQIVVYSSLLFLGCGGSPTTTKTTLTNNNTINNPPTISSLAKQNEFIRIVPTPKRDEYIVVQDVGQGNKEIQLWSADLQKKQSTLLKVNEEYDIKALYALPDHRFTAVVAEKSAPEDYARIVSIDYQDNRVINNVTIYNLPAYYENNIRYDLINNTIILGNLYLQIDQLENQTSIDASTYTYENGYDNPYQDSDYSTGSDWANSNDPYQDIGYSTGNDWSNSNGSYYEDDNYSTSTHQWLEDQVAYESSNIDDDWYIASIGAEQLANQNNAVYLKHGTWKGVGHQFWKVNMDYEITLDIGDNEYYFTYKDPYTTCYGSMTVIARTAESITFQEHLGGGRCVENYFVLTKISDEHFSYESYLSTTGEHTVSGEVYFYSKLYE
jgi:hypothetical protein